MFALVTVVHTCALPIWQWRRCHLVTVPQTRTCRNVANDSTCSVGSVEEISERGLRRFNVQRCENRHRDRYSKVAHGAPNDLQGKRCSSTRTCWHLCSWLRRKHRGDRKSTRLHSSH